MSDFIDPDPDPDPDPDGLDVAGCTDWEPRLGALLFDELASDEREAVESHLRDCEACRAALLDARAAIDTLAEIEPAPYPYSGSVVDDDRDRRRAWTEFRARLSPRREGARASYGVQWMAIAAAVLVALGIAVGVPVGRLTAPPRAEASIPDAPTPPPGRRAVDALERAELLADAGVRYVDGLRALLGDVSRLTIETSSSTSLGDTRERARTLMRDGRLLTSSLDPDRDRLFLRSISRAEVFLEEVAALEPSTGRTDVALLQTSLVRSHLSNDLDRLDVGDELARAIAASGVLGIESGLTRKGF
jgi:Putative zinc-finger